jgi:hypothetical protein
MGCRIKDNLRGVCVDHRGLPFIRVLCEDGTTVKVTYLSHVDEFFYGDFPRWLMGLPAAWKPVGVGEEGD